MLKQTKDEFEKSFAESSRMTVEQLRTTGLAPYPCDCKAARCSGWQMKVKRLVELMKKEIKEARDAKTNQS